MTDLVHAVGGRIVLQLWHVGRVSHSAYHGGALPVAPSAIAATGKAMTPDFQMVPFETPHALTRGRDRRDGRRPSATAPRRAREAGFDGVEIHAANGYLIEQFLSSEAERADGRLRRLGREPARASSTRSRRPCSTSGRPSASACGCRSGRARTASSMPTRPRRSRTSRGRCRPRASSTSTPSAPTRTRARGGRDRPRRRRARPRALTTGAIIANGDFTRDEAEQTRRRRPGRPRRLRPRLSRDARPADPPRRRRRRSTRPTRRPSTAAARTATRTTRSGTGRPRTRARAPEPAAG